MRYLNCHLCVFQGLHQAIRCIASNDQDTTLPKAHKAGVHNEDIFQPAFAGVRDIPLPDAASKATVHRFVRTARTIADNTPGTMLLCYAKARQSKILPSRRALLASEA